jgi:hypothetical protein
MPKRLIPSQNLPSKGIVIKDAQRKELEERGLFPRRVYVTERKHAYVEDEIDAYNEAKIAERDEQIAQERKFTNT